MNRPIAYTYEADYHCPSCTAKRFGATFIGEDREGNAVGAVAPWDEWHSCDDLADCLGTRPCQKCPATLNCGTCGVELDDCSVPYRRDYRLVISGG